MVTVKHLRVQPKFIAKAINMAIASSLKILFQRVGYKLVLGIYLIKKPTNLGLNPRFLGIYKSAKSCRIEL